METNAFASLAVTTFPSSHRLLKSSCCPDKDLVALVSRLGANDRISLWKLSGIKVWDAQVTAEDSVTEEVVDLAWSPDGQSIAVAHKSSRVTIFGIQDGREERVIDLPLSTYANKHSYCATGLWWFREWKDDTNKPSLPDVFGRKDVMTGACHSVLRMLPLLDHFQEDTTKLTATDLFAFQGSQTRAQGKPTVPEFVRIWPTLPTNPFTASIASYHTSQDSDQESPDLDHSNVGSLLVAADNAGHLYSFLDGSYPLGATSVAPCSVKSLAKLPGKMTFLAHLEFVSGAATSSVELQPSIISMPLLDGRSVRDFARSSSTTRELVWYIIRVVKEMRACWFGSDSSGGARELGQKWVRALEAKQTGDFGEKEPTAILDLTRLLLTGRITEPLSDLFGSGEQMSERGIQKWESTVIEALTKLRDFAEKRVAFACQRLHLLLEELRGWSKLPEFKPFGLSLLDLNDMLVLCERAIVISSWLAAVTRRELFRFKEFIAWLRFEVSALNPGNEGNNPPARYDVLEVNHYFMSGLVVSSIDKWFIGPVPQFSLDGVGIPVSPRPLNDVLQRAKQAVKNSGHLAWQQNATQKDLNHVDRNLDALVQDLGARCQRMFSEGTTAASRSVIIARHHPEVVQPADKRPMLNLNMTIRERLVPKSTEMIQHLAMFCTMAEGPSFCVAKRVYKDGSSQSAIGYHVALYDCSFTSDDQSTQLELLEAEFFDDDCIVLVYRLPDQGSSTFIATLNYNELGYQELQPESYVTREDMMMGAISAWRAGLLLSTQLPIKRCRRLVHSMSRPVSLAVNGRAGRRVVCLLDGRGMIMESFDMEGDSEDIDVVGDERDDDGGEV